MPVKFCDDDNRVVKDGRPPLPQYPSASKLRPEATDRQDHLQYVIQQRHASDLFVKEIYHLDSTFRISDANVNANIGAGDPFILSDKSKQELKKESAFIKHAQEYIQQVQSLFPAGGNNVEVRVSNLSYQVKLDPNGDKIKTVYNSSFVYEIYSWMKRIIRGLEKAKTGERKILDNICLTLKPGKIYLLLGPPASGKTSLLKAIAGRLSTINGESVDGSVQYNGLTMEVSHAYRSQWNIRRPCI
jgi:ABC-type multidrug transport system fused ATPase/permease subunit